MKEKRVKYLGVYDFPDEKNDKAVSIACVKKMDYVIDSLNAIGFACDVVSIARSKSHTQKKKIIRTGNNTVTIGPAIGSNIKYVSKIGEIQIRLWLLLYLLINVHQGETIIVYHSQRYMGILYLCSRIKRFKYLLEVEELYYKFNFSSKLQERIEKNTIYNSCGLIVSTKNIVDELSYRKKFAVLHGNYETKEEMRINSDSLTYVVFAGGIERVRNTAFNVCDCARYLDKNIKLLLLGYGDKTSIHELKQKIDIINKELDRDAVEYLGTRVGIQYDEILSRCKIGLNYQNMDEYYMKYAFPSKVLNYLNYGLLTVTTPLTTIRTSRIDDIVYYPEKFENTPEAYAKTINRLVYSNIDRKDEIRLVIKELCEKFHDDLGCLLKDQIF